MTPHEVLGLGPDATQDEAEEAYYRLLLIHHPDLHHGGTAEEVAAAEVRTRALNLAMQRLRRTFDGQDQHQDQDQQDQDQQDQDQHQQRREHDHAPDPGRTRAHARATAGGAPAGAPAAAGSAQDGGAEGRWDARTTSRVASCPFCGTAFTEGHRLRSHVVSSHHVRLDHRRRSRIGRQLDRFSARWRHVSLWYLVPFNAVAALIIAVAVSPLATDFAMWVFGVAMAPTFILLLDRPDGSR